MFPFRSPSEYATGPSNPADLQDFFNRMFKGGPPNDMAANGGGFFPSGPPHHHPPGAGASPFSPPPGPTGFYMPGGHRPDPGETWPDGGKPPRRRKKVRKPFQRWSLFTGLCVKTGTRLKKPWNGHVCLSPACWHAKICSGERLRINLQSDQPSREEWIPKRSQLIESQCRRPRKCQWWCFICHFILCCWS